MALSISTSIVTNLEARRTLKLFFWRCGPEPAGEGAWTGRRDEVPQGQGLVQKVRHFILWIIACGILLLKE